MPVVELLLLSVGLAMDATAASLGKGTQMRRFHPSTALLIAFLFGAFQALMPAIGYVLGSQFATFISAWDHWIAFVLLAFLGGRMLWGAAQPDDEDAENERNPFSWATLLTLSVATSIDALAAGVALAFLDWDIVWSVATIGVVTFVLSFAAVWVGHRFGARFERGAEAVGGAVLVLIGLRILLSHLGILPL